MNFLCYREEALRLLCFEIMFSSFALLKYAIMLMV